LDVIRKARREPIDIKLFGMSSFGLEKDLMRRLVRKLDDLILDGWTISWAGSLNPAGIERRAVQILSNDLMRLSVVCVSQQGNCSMWNDRLFKVKTSFTAGSGNGKKLNRGGGSSPNLLFASAKIDGAAT